MAHDVFTAKAPELSTVFNTAKTDICETAAKRIQGLRADFNAAKADMSGDDLIRGRLKHMAEVDRYIVSMGMDHGAYAEEDRGPEARQLLRLIRSAFAEHTGELKEILQTRSWDSLAGLGKDAVSHAWLLVQHSDHDVQFQERMLKDMAKQGINDNYAYLFDRVAKNSGRPQRYGTQFTKEGIPYPIEDPSRLDERRKEAGLVSMAEYTQVMAQHRARFNR